MALSGSKDFELDVTEYIEEALNDVVLLCVQATTLKPPNAL